MNISELGIAKQHSIEATRQLFQRVVSVEDNQTDIGRYILINPKYTNTKEIFLSINDLFTQCHLACRVNLLNHSIEYYFRTKTNQKTKHPDLNAKEFERISLLYFANQNIPIEIIRGEYLPYSDSYQQFIVIYDKFLDNSIQAINRTRSGLVNAENGYRVHHKKDIKIDLGNKISSVFRKIN